MVSIPRSLRERRVFVDSSAYLALLDDDDQFHGDAIRIVNQIAEQRFRHFVTNAIVIEAHALILSAMGIRTATRFLQDIENSNTVVIRVRAADEERAKQIIDQYDDKDFHSPMPSASS
jgi:predicted nucleic acid-binding protein